MEDVKQADLTLVDYLEKRRGSLLLHVQEHDEVSLCVLVVVVVVEAVAVVEVEAVAVQEGYIQDEREEHSMH